MRLYDPRNFGGHSQQLRADFGLHQTSALTTAATLNGDPIGGWLETALRGLDWKQTTSGKRPTLLLGATPVGGPAVRFTGSSSQNLDLTTSLFRQQNRTVITVIRPITVSAISIILGSNVANWYAAVTPTARMIASHATAAAVQQTTNSPTSSLTLGAWAVLAHRWQWDGGSNVTVGLWKNGVSLGETPYTTGLQAVTATVWRLGAFGGTANFLTADIAQLDFLARDLTNTEMTLAMGDLMQVYGVT